MATIKEIAKLAGVSHVTVSKVLSGQNKVTRVAARKRAENILRIADELGYRPDPSARSLRRGRTGMIAVLGNTSVNIDDINSEEMLIIRAVAQMLAERELSLSAQLTATIADNFRLPPWKTDAVLVVAAGTAAQVREVEDAGCAYVSLNGYCGPRGSSVQFDDTQGMRLALEELIGLGHRRIAYLDDLAVFEHRSVGLRRSSYLETLRLHGLEALPTYSPGDVNEDSILGHLRMLREQHAATAAVTFDPFAAIMLYQAVHRLGLVVPRDLSVITFNDTLFGQEAMLPALTAVTRPINQTARAVVELLIERIEHERLPPREIIVATRLIKRESIAPPWSAADR